MPTPVLGQIPEQYFSGGSHQTDGELREMLNTAALADTTRIVHQPIVSVGRGRVVPAAGPVPLVIGSLLTFSFSTPATDALYAEFKIPSAHDGAYAAFHAHWTKASDTNELGQTVRWLVSVTQFNGISNDVNITPVTLVLDGTYNDAGTTTRLVHRTPDSAITLTPGWYIGVRITLDSGGTSLAGGAALLSVDLRLSEEINR